MSATTGDTADVPNGYTDTDRKAYGSQQECADAWAAKQWPSHNETERPSRRTGMKVHGAVLYSSPNFQGIQFSNGAGALMHYSTREAIRTKTGVVLNNQQCWSSGFAHCSPPGDYDATVPLQAIEEFLADDYTVYDITAVWGQPEYVDSNVSDHTYERYRPHNSIIEVGNGHQYIAIGRDPSIIDGDRHFAFDATEYVNGIDVDMWDLDADYIADLIDDWFTPDVVRESDRPVVESHEYTKTRLDENERESHIGAGGNVVESQSRWRDDRINMQQYRADLRGDVIVRQGEWFFIPRPSFEADEKDLERGTDPTARMGNHRAMRSDGSAIDEHGDLYVRGQIIHADNDHNAINLGDTWHEAVENGVDDVLVYDRSPGRSRGRRGGWD